LRIFLLECLLEPYAVKVARTVLRRGKSARSYLFRLGELLAHLNCKIQQLKLTHDPFRVGTIIEIIVLTVNPKNKNLRKYRGKL